MSCLQPGESTAFSLETDVVVWIDGVANMIRTGSVEQVTSAIQTGAKYGMQTPDRSLEKHWASGYIDMDAQLSAADAWRLHRV